MAVDFLVSAAKAFWELSAQMAPYLLLGFFIGGLLHSFLPARVIARVMGRESFGSVTKATLIGIPLPLCSCGVLPVAAAARESGAGRAPTLSFLITTPVTGVDSILATVALLGWPFAGFRILASLLLGMAAGAAAIFIPEKSEPAERGEDFCGSCEKAKEPSGLWPRLKGALLYGAVELPKSLSGSVLLGLLIGALIAAFAPESLIERHVGGGLTGILVATAIGIPLYVCATGSIPIAAALVMKGFSVGAAMAFLIAGPATNAVALATVKKILGRRSLVIYLVTIFLGAIGFGLALDYALPKSLDMSAMIHRHHGAALSFWSQAAGLILLAGLGYFKVNNWVQNLRARERKATAEQGARIVLNVSNMTCEHCKEQVLKNLTGIDKVKTVGVDLREKKVVVSASQDLDPELLIDSLKRIDFHARLVEKIFASS